MSTRIVLVTGSGRSGTSSVAGSLKRLGLHIPQPEVEADEKNPRGYYEPLWVTEFHKRVLNPVPVRTIDTRPWAHEIAAEVGARPEVVAELRKWLSGQLDAPQILIKDPRAFWILPTWTKVAEELGAEVVTLTMLRHPTEVVRSRDSAYLSEQPEQFRRQRETANVAAWVNAAHQTEAVTRGLPRAFVRYDDLLADWRSALARAAEQTGISLDMSGAAEVDNFVDAKLNRSAITWEDLSVSPMLRQLADRAWESMSALVDDPRAAGVQDDLAAQRAAYDELYDWSSAMAMDGTTERVTTAKRELRRKLRGEMRELREQNEAVRREIEDIRKGVPVRRSFWRR